MALKVLRKIDDIGFCMLTSSDVVRHPLVQKIVQAYDEYEKKANAPKKDVLLTKDRRKKVAVKATVKGKIRDRK